MREEIEKSLLMQSFLLMLLYPVTLYIFDYGSLAILFIVLGYTVQKGDLDIKKAAAYISILTFINTILTFTNFGIEENYLSLIVQMFIFSSLTYFPFEKKIGASFYNRISKNALFIFCFHILCMAFIAKFILKT